MESAIVVAMVTVTLGAIAFGLAVGRRPRAGPIGHDLLERTRAIAIVAGGLLVIALVLAIGRVVARGIDPVLGPIGLLVAGVIVALGGGALLAWAEAIVRQDARLGEKSTEPRTGAIRRTGRVAIGIGLAVGAIGVVGLLA